MVADSAEVVIFILEASSIYLLEAILRKQFIRGIANVRDFDNNFAEIDDAWMRQWEKYKVSILEQILSQKEFSQ